MSASTTSIESGTLWIVATPIGTLDDCSPRARRVLDGAELILAEDTRRAGTLLRHLGIETRGRVTSFHEHNERDRLPRVLRTLRAGGAVALMSDAGTPVLSDPGFILVREVRREGLPVASVPGPSSFTAALAASGQPPLPATLGGFLPARSGPRRRRVAELARVPWTLVVLLSPHRLAAELTDLADGLGHERSATLLAELSKLHERAVIATLGELAESDDAGQPRGEYVVVIAPPDDGASAGAADSERIRAVYETALDAGMTRKDAMRAVASKLGISRKEVFDSLIDHETGADR